MVIKRLIQNILWAVIAASVPLASEYATATPDNELGRGFAILFYKPFDYVYLLLVTAVFVLINTIRLPIRKGPVVIGIMAGISISLIWLFVTFLAVAELHLYLGGKL